MAYLIPARQDEIDTIVNDILLKTGYSYPENDIVEIVEATGLSVLETNFTDHPEVNAMLVYRDKKNNDKPTVYLNSSLCPTRKRFTLAHELAHFVMHKQGNVKFRINNFNYRGNSQYVLEETEANYFAASLLVPEEKLKALLNLLGEKFDLIAEYFGVSKEVIENRIKWIKTNKR